MTVQTTLTKAKSGNQFIPMPKFTKTNDPIPIKRPDRRTEPNNKFKLQ